MNDLSLSVLFGILVAMLLLSAFFSGSETALMALNRYRLRHLVKLKHAGAIKAQTLLLRPDRLLGMILLGNIFVNTLAASVVTIIAIRLYPQYESNVIVADAVLILVTLIFSEATPKTFAAVRPEPVAFPAAWVYIPLLKLFYPVIEFVNIFVNLLLRLFRVDVTKFSQEKLSKEELKVRVGKQFEMLHLLEIRQENQRLAWQLDKYQETEKKLRERETRLAKMLDVTGDALISIDESGQIAYINKAAETLLKLPAEDFQDGPVSALSERLETICQGVSEIIGFPFRENVISSPDNPTYFTFTIRQPDEDEDAAAPVRLCVLPLSLDQEFYLLMFQRVLPAGLGDDESLVEASLPHLIDQINRNVERTQVLSEYLARITPEDLQKHRHLFADLENVDKIIQSLSGALPSDADDEQQYREALVKLMQDCHYYWQKVTGESIIDLAEKSRIWSVSIDNGRLRTRSMNRYLSIDKLPSNPRWRQVARTAYFVLSKVSHDAEAKSALEKSVARLQDIVEAKALT